MKIEIQVCSLNEIYQKYYLTDNDNMTQVRTWSNLLLPSFTFSY